MGSIKRILVPAALILTLLWGCAPGSAPGESPGQTAPPPQESGLIETAGTGRGDGKFTLRYYPEYSLNPITGTSADNHVVMSLMYEGLFRLGADFAAVPVLCESYETRDGVTYTFEVKANVAMSDGSTLTGEDVQYSLNRAREDGRFSARLCNIEGVSAAGLTVTVVLERASYRLPELLDIPIIKSGSIASKAPPGTGAYRLAAQGEDELPRLIAAPGYRDKKAQSAETIYLRECDERTLAELFSDGEIDALRVDPLEGRWQNLRADYEIHAYDTTTLHYFGLSGRTLAMRDARIRRAIALCVDRDAAIHTVTGGYALAAPLAISPAAAVYDAERAKALLGGGETVSSLFAEAGLYDNDHDALLEYPGDGGLYTAFSFTILVNAESAGKVEAAEALCARLIAVGIDAAVEAVPFDEFLERLRAGNFDIYYGEVTLPADFDLTALLAPEGALAYGGLQEETYASLISAFLKGRTAEAAREAAMRLAGAIYESAPMIPMFYTRQAVYSGRDVVRGFNPGVSGLFADIGGMEINVK